MEGDGQPKPKPKRAPKRTMFGIAPPAPDAGRPSAPPDEPAAEAAPEGGRASKRPRIGTIQGMQSVPPPAGSGAPPRMEQGPGDAGAKGKRGMPAGIFATGKSLGAMPKAERLDADALDALPKDTKLEFDASALPPLPSMPSMPVMDRPTPVGLTSAMLPLEDASGELGESLPPLDAAAGASELGGTTLPPPDGSAPDYVSVDDEAYSDVDPSEVSEAGPAGDAWGTLPPGPPPEPVSGVVQPLTVPPLSGLRRSGRPSSAPPSAPDPEHEEARQVVLRSNPPPRPSGVLNLANDMRDKFALDDFSGAIRAAELLLGREPENMEAKSIVAASRERLSQAYLSKLGALDGVPRVVVADADVRWLGLDHRAGFLLSRIDGMATTDEVMDMSGFERFEALRVLADLLERGAIVVQHRQARRR